MALVVLTGPVIQAGESLSDGLDCTGGEIIRLTMPADWTPANLTFQISTDGNGYNDLVDHQGKEIMMPVVTGSAVVLAPLQNYLRAFAYLKLRSGSRDFPVPQAARREFAVAIDTPPTRAT